MGAVSLAVWLCARLCVVVSLAGAEVLPSLSDCGWCVLGGREPLGLESGLSVCQRLGQRYHYCSRYSSHYKSPIFSACRYPGSPSPHTPLTTAPAWYWEPQIDDAEAGEEMVSSEGAVSESQAVDGDYHGQEDTSEEDRYQPVPLCPLGPSEGGVGSASQTHTNAVPLRATTASGWHHQVEENIRRLAWSCQGSGRSLYLLAGMDGDSGETLNGVRVPSRGWAALCCTHTPEGLGEAPGDPDPEHEQQEVPTMDKDFSFAFLKELAPVEGEAQRMGIRELQERLGSGRLFEACRGTQTGEEEEETFREVEELLGQHETISPALEQPEAEEDNSPSTSSAPPATSPSEVVAETPETGAEIETEVEAEVEAEVEVEAGTEMQVKMVEDPSPDNSPSEDSSESFRGTWFVLDMMVRLLRYVVMALFPTSLITGLPSFLVTIVHQFATIFISLPVDLAIVVTSILADTAEFIGWSYSVVRFLISIL